MKSNCTFLNDRFPILAMLESLGEDYLYTDSNSCLIKLGHFVDSVVNLVLDFDNVSLQ
ncbi:hypothetical protein GH811_01230 [Acetobacterium malicum]|uniref:Uncharacterized protein n=1 Tax=Acetobacterium malicum TaxID=52692 RepID=A0ABR6YSZ2_9FIRM|nr:hypothetical protein [Acetobacterium malicum]MBC3898237.1 hypothetical protein [Acetobacterium malicum]